MRAVRARRRSEAPDLVHGERHEPEAGSVLHCTTTASTSTAPASRRSPTRTARTPSSWSPDSTLLRRHLVARRSAAPSLDASQRDATSKSLMDVEHGDVSALCAAGWQPPEVFVAKGRDGTTDIWGVIFRPTNFDPDEEVSGDREHLRRAAGFVRAEDVRASTNGMRNLAELGFIVVQIDGMGTSNRSKAFHDVAWQNLGDAGFPDRILWHKAVAAKYPWYDISRVGIYGTSAGGQNSLGGTALPSRVLQGRGVGGGLPRQPHGQDLVERAVDGLAGRAAVRRVVERRQRVRSCRASCCWSSASSTRTSIRRRRCRWSTR